MIMAKMKTQGLDGLRAIASLAIIIFTHYFFFPVEGGVPFNNVLTQWFWPNSSYMVDLFFVISGFVMALNYKDRIKSNSIDFYLYIRKRLIRFYPMMIFSHMCVLIMQVMFAKCNNGEFFAGEIINNNNIFTFILNVLCLQSLPIGANSFNAPTWFLSAVFIMYIIFYFIVLRCGKNNKEDVAFLICIVLGLILAVQQYPPLFGLLFNHRAVIGFFSGCITFKLCENFDKLKDKKIKYFILTMSTLTFIIIFILDIIYGHDILGTQPTVVYDLAIWPLAVFLTVNMGFLRKTLSIKPMEFFSKISLSLYLMHYPVMILIELLNVKFKLQLNYSSNAVFVTYIFTAIIVAFFCYYFFERKCSEFLKNIK